jgi:hypothetical protein
VLRVEAGRDGLDRFGDRDAATVVATPGEFEQFAADASAPVGGVDEEGGEEPVVAADERGRVADDAAVVLGDEGLLAVVGEKLGATPRLRSVAPSALLGGSSRVPTVDPGARQSDRRGSNLASFPPELGRVPAVSTRWRRQDGIEERSSDAVTEE